MHVAVRDRDLPSPCAYWVDPDVPLTTEVRFEAHRPTATRTAFWAWFVVAGLAAIGVVVLVLLGAPTGLVATFGVVCVSSAVLAAWTRSRWRSAEEQRQAAFETGRWRLGRFWSPEAYLLRHQADHCCVIERGEEVTLQVGRKKVDVGQGQGRYEVWLAVGRGEPEFVECEFSVSSSNLDEAVRFLEQRRDAFASWLASGDAQEVLETEGEGRRRGWLS